MKWEDLTVEEFKDSIKETKGVAIIPLGCLEKHGYHMPLGTDMFIARAIAEKASEIEPALVVPIAPYGIISEAQHRYGCLSISSKLQYELLEELCDELARNGYYKIIFVDGHGGNKNFLQYFMQSRLENNHPYVTYYFDLGNKGNEFWDFFQNKYGKVLGSGHADIFEASAVCAIDSSLMRMDRIQKEETAPLHRLDNVADAGLYTGIGWYADYPCQIAGDPTGADAEKGKDVNKNHINRLVKAIKVVKEDDVSFKLLKEYYGKHQNPEGY